MSELASLPHAPSHNAPAIERRSWFRAHLGALTLLFGTLLVLFAIWAIRR